MQNTATKAKKLDAFSVTEAEYEKAVTEMLKSLPPIPRTVRS